MEQTKATAVEGAAARGVWRAPYDLDGYPVFIAIDSRGRRVAEVVMFRGLVPSRVKKTLSDILDTVDPRYQLRLVSSKSPKRR